MHNKVSIFGGSGMIGKYISHFLQKNNYQVISVSRRLQHNSDEITKVQTNFADFKEIADILENTRYVINLTGESIAGRRWTKEYKDKLYASRINTTRMIVKGISSLKKPPECFISASAIGIYGDRKNELLDEVSELADDFLSNLCKDWEQEANNAMLHKIRTINLRIGIVFSKQNSALQKIIKPYKLFLGGDLGSGKQWLSYIHIEDLANIINHIFLNKTIEGPVNAVSPIPVTNSELGNTISKILKRPSYLKIPAFILRIVLGEFAGSLLASQRVIPKKIAESGYKFRFSNLNDALKDLLM